MKIQIKEVWNSTADQEDLAVIYATQDKAQQAVYEWIRDNRPDLQLARSINDHGYYACAIA